MKPYKPALYTSPIDVPEGRSGKVFVKHTYHRGKIPIINFREAFTRGVTPVNAVLEKPLRIHGLYEDGVGEWMTDSPQELNQIAEMLYLVNPQGRVLVGGLGLGIVAEALAARQGVDSITVVERNLDVVKLTAIGARVGRYNMHIGGIFTALRDHRLTLEHDFYLLDTWQGTNEGTWWGQVLPLRRAIRNRFGTRPIIHAWAEDQMAGQIFHQLVNEAPEHWYYRKPWMGLSEDEAQFFMVGAGLPEWEKKYGKAFDAVRAEMQATKDKINKLITRRT